MRLISANGPGVEPDKTGTAVAVQVKTGTSLPAADDIAKALVTALTAAAAQTATSKSYYSGRYSSTDRDTGIIP